MKEPDPKIYYLWQQFKESRCSAAERLELMQWAAQKENEAQLLQLIGREVEENSKDEVAIMHMLTPVEAEEVFQRIMEKREEAPVVTMDKARTKKRKWWWIPAAAAILILVVGISYFLTSQQKTVPAGKTAQQSGRPSDVAPGHDGAVLTLADGRKIILDNAKDGKITEVAVKNGNKVSYQNSDQSKVEYNTMSTPKGRQFSLVLPDGSQVWLNAASSITYPTAFVGNDRTVSISGEAYFEVAHDASKPFHVTVNGMEVQVLGTHFNINSYSDEGSIKATLLQGSIRVSVGDQTQLIKPGEQAKVSGNGKIQLASGVDVDQVMAWKNGYFSFKDADIQTVMRQLSRWYDIEVRYEGKNTETFSGKIGRNLTLKDLLDGLGQTRVHYRIEEGKRVVILP